MNLKRLARYLLPVLFGIPLMNCVGSAGASSDFFEQVDGGWIQNSYWFRGDAEINFYDSRLTYYGQPRETRQVVHILVTEDHRPDQLVKADDWRQPGLLKVLKFNLLRTVQTGIYDYRQMMSVFFNREDGRFFKMTFGSQEWCGSSFKEIVNFGGSSRFDFNTYWDGQGNGEYQVQFPRDLVLYDALPVQLRMLKWEAGQTRQLLLLPGQISSRVSPPEIERAEVTVEAQERLEVPAGSFDAYRIRLESGENQELFWFEKSFPHRMLKWQGAGGDFHQLRASKKLPYWKLNQIGDETHLP